MMLKRTIAAALSCVLALSAPMQAWGGGLQEEVDSMFNNLGAMGNYTEPGAFRGQTYNTYTGGSMFLRSPNKVYQLASIQFPYAKAGCGGIDVFAGSFSFLSASAFKDALKNITAALPGVAFQLALSAVSPLLGQKAEWAKTLENMVNNARINSCETASSLVRGAANQMGFDAFSSCIRIAVATGLEPDENSARVRCSSAQNATIAGARGSSDPSVKSLAQFAGNLTWESLKLVNGIDDAERELIMSILGTVIYYPIEQGRTPEAKAPTLLSITQLLYGHADAGNGRVKGHLLRCNNYTDCMSVTDDTAYTYTPFTTKVEEKMKSLSDKIRERRSPSDSEIGFVNMTNEPVYRMLSVGNGIKGSAIAESLIRQYRDVIAADYAYNMLERYVRIGMTALEKNHLLNTEQEAAARERRDNARAYLRSLAEQRASLYDKVGSFKTVADELERLERQLRTSMPQHVLDMLGQSGSAIATR